LTGTRRAVFLDRDGTLTVERGYVTRPEDLELLPGAAAAVRLLNDAGLLAVLVSNQSGVARGLMTEDDLGRVHAALEKALSAAGARLDAAYYCPNLEGGAVERFSRDASCRKPEPGMLERARRDLGADVESSFIVGDQTCDLELASRVGATAVLVLTGAGRTTLREARERALRIDHCSDDIGAAVRWILARIGPEEAP
jgi:D-glycero-D-manno-heptose 1,7-bisphosphate phosphatase